MRQRQIGVVVLAAAVVAVLAWLLWPRGGGTEARRDEGRGAGTAHVAGRGAPARGGIDGVVLDPGGVPIAGAVVRAARSERLVGDEADAPTATSGADGRFALEIAAGHWTVTAGAPGRVPASADAEVAAGGQARVELRLAPGGARVHGTVIDATGGPVGGALVVLAPEHGVLAADARRAVAAISAADGTFEVGVAAGRWRVATSHPEYVDDERALDVGPGGAELEIRLVPGAVIEGTVRDRASGQPVAGAHVRYAREVVAADPMPGMGGGAAEPRERGGVDAADGTFRIAGLGPGRIVLTAETDDDRASDEPTEVQLGIAETATGVEVLVSPALSIAGRVQYDDGTPAAGARVMIGARGEMRGVDADDRGAFHAGGLRPGHYRVTAETEDGLAGEPASVELEKTPVRDVVVTVKRGAYVTGRVDPAELAEVAVVRPDVEPDLGAIGMGPQAMMRLAGGPSTRTAADGTFRIGPFEPGPVRLGGRAADGRRGEVDVTVAAKGAAGVVIPLEARGRIAGRVRTKAGAPVPGAVVSLRRVATGPRRTTIVNGVDVAADRAPCDAQGRFAISGLDAGTWELTVLDDRGAPVAFDRKDREAPEQVPLANNQARDDVDLVVEALDGVIAGTVIGPDRKPVADAWVTVSSETGILGIRPDRAGPPPDRDAAARSEMTIAVLDSGGVRAGEIPPVLTGADGRFEVRHLRRGTYRVAAEGLRGGARGAASGVATGSEITIALVQLAKLRGTVSRGGAPVADYAVIARGPSEKHRDVHDDTGRFTITGLDPGEYEVEARAGGGTGRATVTIEAAKEQTVAIEIAEPGVVAGKVVDAAGAPIAGRLVVVMPRQPEGMMRIEIDGAPPTTAPDGSFRVPSEAGPRTLVVMGPQGPLVHQDVDVVAGKITELGTLTAQPPPR